MTEKGDKKRKKHYFECKDCKEKFANKDIMYNVKSKKYICLHCFIKTQIAKPFIKSLNKIKKS
jgi:predicted SprT family Zn-dependent metalloprotease